jgi:hypothetical protein
MIVFAEDDVWALSLRGALRWTRLNPGGPPPAGIHSAIFDARRHRIVALADPDNAVWELSLSNAPRWSPIDAVVDEPPVRVGNEVIYDRTRDRLVTWNWRDQEIWTLSLSGTPRWTRLTPTGLDPWYFTGHSLIHDEKRDRLVMLRTHDHGTAPYPFELSLSAPLAWQPMTTTGGRPFTEQGQSAIYDPVRDRMILFGGHYFYNELNETWALSFSDAPSFKMQSAATTSLQPAYPNPFNPSVTIPFELERDGPATLAIYDVAGRRVKTLVDEWTSRGVHAVSWEGDSDRGERVASGVYFYRLQASGITETRKLVMLK